MLDFEKISKNFLFGENVDDILFQIEFGDVEMIDEILVIDIKFIYKKRLVFFFLVLVLLKLEVEEEYFVLDYEFEFDYDDDEMVKKVYLLLFNLNVLWLLME